MSIEEKIRELISYKEEREYFEFKENWFEPNALGEYISALSNSAFLSGKDNGYFIWGVNDITHKIVGTNFNFYQDYNKEPLINFLVRNITPNINFHFEEIMIDDKRLVVLIIPSAKNYPTSFMHKRFIRLGSSKTNLERYPELEADLFFKLNHKNNSISKIKSDNQSLNFTKLFTYYAGRGLLLKFDTFKKNLHLIDSDGDYNLLASLLSDDSLVSSRVSIFGGNDKTYPLHSVREFGNDCILNTLNNILEYGKVLNFVKVDETNRTMERNDKTLFDFDSFREALINAFMHNDWSSGHGPQIYFFTDRVEIISHGSLPLGQTLEGFYNGESIPQNESLVFIFAQLHITESTGRGVPKILKKYSKDAFEIAKNHIKVTLKYSWDLNVGDKASDKLGDKLNDTQSKIVSIMRDNPNVTAVELMSLLGRGKTAIQNNITYLRKNSIIERVGSNKNGYWKVLK